jgi:hypothetical protein
MTLWCGSFQVCVAQAWGRISQCYVPLLPSKLVCTLWNAVAEFATTEYARLSRALTLYQLGDVSDAILQLEDLEVALRGYAEVHAALAAILYVERPARLNQAEQQVRPSVLTLAAISGSSSSLTCSGLGCWDDILEPKPVSCACSGR